MSFADTKVDFKNIDPANLAKRIFQLFEQKKSADLEKQYTENEIFDCLVLASQNRQQITANFPTEDLKNIIVKLFDKIMTLDRCEFYLGHRSMMGITLYGSTVECCEKDCLLFVFNKWHFSIGCGGIDHFFPEKQHPALSDAKPNSFPVNLECVDKFYTQCFAVHQIIADVFEIFHGKFCSSNFLLSFHERIKLTFLGFFLGKGPFFVVRKNDPTLCRIGIVEFANTCSDPCRKILTHYLYESVIIHSHFNVSIPFIKTYNIENAEELINMLDSKYLATDLNMIRDCMKTGFVTHAKKLWDSKGGLFDTKSQCPTSYKLIKRCHDKFAQFASNIDQHIVCAFIQQFNFRTKDPLLLHCLCALLYRKNIFELLPSIVTMTETTEMTNTNYDTIYAKCVASVQANCLSSSIILAVLADREQLFSSKQPMTVDFESCDADCTNLDCLDRLDDLDSIDCTEVELIGKVIWRIDESFLQTETTTAHAEQVQMNDVFVHAEHLPNSPDLAKQSILSDQQNSTYQMCPVDLSDLELTDVQ